MPSFQSRAAGDEQGRENREHEMGVGSGGVDPALLDTDQQTGSDEQRAADREADGAGAGDRHPDDGGCDGEEYPQDDQHVRGDVRLRAPGSTRPGLISGPQAGRSCRECGEVVVAEVLPVRTSGLAGDNKPAYATAIALRLTPSPDQWAL